MRSLISRLLGGGRSRRRVKPTEVRGRDRFEREPWRFAAHATPAEQAAQRAYQRELEVAGDVRIGDDAYVSPDATISVTRLRVGDGSAIAAGVQVGYDVSIGRNCTLNYGAVVRGNVKVGDDVRIATGAQVLGFNHVIDGLDRPMWQQGLRLEGITIGDDVWVGANAVVLDGVRIGSHAVIGAGSVVTHDVPSWMIAVGNPARTVRSRKYGSASREPDIASAWEAFLERVAGQMPRILERSLVDGGYVDFPGDRPRVRPFADAVELASFVGIAVPGFDRPSLVATLGSFQDETTGLVPGPFGEDGFDPGDRRAAMMEFARSSYNAMAVGYALSCLGTRLPHPIHVAARMDEQTLRTKLDGLPWAENSWSAGAWIDQFATACHLNALDHDVHRDMSDLRNWLDEHVDPTTGLWGRQAVPGDWLQPVNGFYRLTRGAHAQFGWPLPHPRRTIDTVLEHAHDERHLSSMTATACNVLDVVHPLLLSLRQTDHRRRDIEAVARFWLRTTIDRWQDGEGMPFELAPGGTPRLQGTEMWLAIAWLCAHLLGIARSDDAVRPKGIHRL